MPKMSAKAQRELLERVGVHNAHNFADVKGSPPFIVYRPQELGRVTVCAAWQVCRAWILTCPVGHFMDHGNKTFPIYQRAEKAPALKAAQKWAEEEYGVTEWAKTPFDSWMDKEFVEKRLAELLAQAEAK